MAVFSSPLLPPLGPWSLASVALLVWAFIKLKNFGKREAYLPPGPPTLPILGNLHNFPKTHAHKKFTEWSKEFGEIFSLKLGNSNVIVLNKPETINQVLEKGSATTSDRPPNHFFRVIEGGEVLNLVMMPHNSRWKSTRRAAHEVLSPQACRSHLEVQQAEGIQLAFNFLTDPARFYDHTRRYAHSVIMSVMFGMRVPRTESQFLVDFWDLTDDMIDITSPTNHPPVDLLPIFKLVPERFARWKGLCRKLREKQLKTFVPLIKEVENRLARGENTGCFMEEVVSHAKEWGLDEGDVLYLGFMIVQAGSDTTAVFIQNFILFMMAFPHVMKKAQREMDAVIGTDRMPRVDDIANLPYLRAMMNETHRFRPAAPLGVPHVATADVQYGEHVIPKGSMIFQNTYGVFHDPEIFENPEEFNPDRFIKNPELNKLPDLVFGSGRRFCVGVHLARNSLTINILNIVWGFNIEKPHEDFEPPIHNYEDGLVNYPLHFEAVLKPRSQQREAVLRQEYKNTEYTFKKYESHFSEEDKRYIDESRANA